MKTERGMKNDVDQEQQKTTENNPNRITNEL
jgi:hypothetical protein